MKAIRWNRDHDSYLGPFTWSSGSNYRNWAIILKSGRDEDDDVGQSSCHMRISIGGTSILIALPEVIKPWKRKVHTKYWSAADIERMGRDWYWEIKPREYGFSYSDGFLQLFYGRATDDSSTEQRKSWFLPWTQWRFVRHSFYGLTGDHFYTEVEAETQAIRKLGDKTFRERQDIVRQWEDRCPTQAFPFKDFDGEQLVATTKIEEREWLFGRGYFKWLSLFRRPKIHRSLDIRFSGETGHGKGSWKGGTVGHSIEMLPGELHESAFRRYCAEHEMTVI
jgi:hypothetical protein